MDDTIRVGMFVELRAENTAEKPWLAEITSIKSNNDVPVEVECKWLWHPKDYIRDYGVEELDSNTYGTREVFLSYGNGEYTYDWNPIDSIKWEVYVFKLEDYRQLVASNFTLHDPVTNTYSGPYEPNRCWFYRQKVDIESKTLTPLLEHTIHRPSLHFQNWCQQNSIKLEKSYNIKLPENIERTTLVPENPERIYYCCTKCNKRFETRQADCIEYELLFDSKYFRSKLQINQPDIEIVCPPCNSQHQNQKEEKRMRVEESTSNISLSEKMEAPTLSTRIKPKFTRQERFCAFFDECLQNKTLMSNKLHYSDSKALCSEFFVEFDKYVSDNQLNAKQSYQKLHEIFQNLKRDNKMQLRFKILCKDLNLSDLIRLDAKELAPEAIKRRRQQEAEKYFQQQVLLQSNESTNSRKVCETSELDNVKTESSNLLNITDNLRNAIMNSDTSEFDILYFLGKYSEVAKIFSYPYKDISQILQKCLNTELSKESLFLLQHSTPLYDEKLSNKLLGKCYEKSRFEFK